MRLLLDTCTFLWLIWDQDELAATPRELIRDPGNTLFLSSASLWEMLVKQQAGKLVLPSSGNPALWLTAMRVAHRIDPLPIDEVAISQLPQLPPLHRDPFDRMLICQAISEGLTILTPDELIRRYPVRTMW